MANKYKNTKVIVGGIKFDSKKEAKRYTELRLLQQAKKIKELELQKKFLLQDKFKKNGKTIRKIEYIADFYYYDIAQGKYIVEDVKASPYLLTKEYKLKKKLFEFKYPEFTIKEIY